MPALSPGLLAGNPPPRWGAPGHGIGVRDGRFCAHPLFARLAAGRAVRASLGLGSTSEDVDRLVTAVRAFLEHGPSWTYEETGGEWSPAADPRSVAGPVLPPPCRAPR